MTKILVAFALILAAAATLTAQAQTTPNGTATANFNVKVTLTSQCKITTAPSEIDVAYTSLQGSDGTGSTPIGVTCTNTLPYTLALNGDASSATLGLTGTLDILNGSNTAVSSDTGTGSAVSYTIKATIPQGQAGTCANGSCNATLARTLTITY